MPTEVLPVLVGLAHGVVQLEGSVKKSNILLSMWPTPGDSNHFAVAIN